ncbi:MAG: hypothetical protein AB1444_13625 [Spirochaetota bacterium]
MYTLLLLPCSAYAQYYPFVLKANPPICNQCKNFDMSLFQSLVNALISSQIFIGDSSLYSVPAGAYNPPSADSLTRTLSLTITRTHTIQFKELTPYLKEKMEFEEYSIQVTVSSATNPHEFFVEYQKIPPRQLETTFNDIAQKIIEYYASQRIPLLYQKPFAIHLTAITLAPVYITAPKNLSDYAHSAAGATCMATIDNTYYHVSVMPSITWFTLNKPVASIQSWHSIAIMLNAGYRLALPFSFSITPYIGAGYILHIINGDKHHTYPPFSYAREFLYNPQVASGITLGFTLDPQLSLTGSAAYTMFFESSSYYSYIQYLFGFTFHSNLLLMQSTVHH